MRLALLTALLSEGGAARVLVRLANAWTEAGHNVHLFSFEDSSVPPFYPLAPGVQLRHLDINRHSANLWESLTNNRDRLLTIRRSLLAVRPDAVVSFIDTANVRTLLALAGSGVPVIVSERVHPRHERIGPAWEALRRLSYPLASALVVQTQDIARHCRHWNRRVRIIPNPVLPAEHPGGAPTLPRPTLLAVGRLYPQKGYDTLLDAFALATRNRPEWSLCIAGRGPLEGELRERIQTLGLEGRVLLLGQTADVGGLLAQADAFVMSSRYEGFPNALAEAMAEGLACVATDCPSGPAELIDHDVNGLLAPPSNPAALAEALLRLMSDPALRERLGAQARIKARNFSLPAIMAQWDACLAEVLGRQGRTGAP